MIKFRLYCNKDKETEYLNEMARNGYALTGFCMGFYSFDRCQPGEYIYQIDITEGMFRVSNDYREFMRDMEVEIVCLWGPWVILRKRAAEGEFVLYTDVESSIEHYSKIRWMFKIVTIIEICVCLVEIVAAVNNSVMVGWGFAFILLAFIVAFIREIHRINGILAELKARTGMEAEEKGLLNRRGELSGFLAAGFLLNGIGYLMPRFGVSEQADFLYGLVRGLCHGLALVFLCIGLISTFRGSR